MTTKTPSLVIGGTNWASKEAKLLGYYQDDNEFFNAVEGDFSRASSKTVVNRDRLIEVLGVDVASVDFQDDVNGALFLEPQSTNLVTYSEDFSNSNWLKVRSFISDNVLTSPSGIINASKFIGSSVNGDKKLIIAQAVTSGIKYTGSIFVKKAEFNSIVLRFNTVKFPSGNVIFNLDTNTAIASGIIDDFNIISLDNDWFRLSITSTADSSGSNGFEYLLANNGSFVTTGNNLDGLYIWGAQVEALPHATSYIPTNASAVTRVKDVINNFGDVNTFNNDEGVLLVDFKDYYRNGGQGIGVYDVLGNQVYTIFYYGGNYDFYNGSVFMLDRSIIYPVSSKIAIVYTLTSIKFYINGIEAPLLNSSLSDNTPYKLGTILSNSLVSKAKLKQIQVYKEALTDVELEYLTTYGSYTDLANSNNYNLILDI